MTCGALAKEAFDRVVSGIALILLAPFMAMIAIWIKATSPGPVLYRQVRIGKDGRPFALLKFRSMVPGADRIAANITPRGDPRVTPVGRVLRRWYLDELPQLLNVVRGDMSLVGPRPETAEFAAELLPHECTLLTVRPGLVGASTLAFMNEADLLAEANDPVTYYRTTLLHERAQRDLEYLKRRSLPSDIAILFRQLSAIFRQRPSNSKPSSSAVRPGHQA
ncbi:MAG TPA: sugar transferase [Mycobacterium sp.]|nr:sugar transferase [Mycobacterium sp.]